MGADRAIAKVCLKAALEGDINFIRLLFNRVDGLEVARPDDDASARAAPLDPKVAAAMLAAASAALEPLGEQDRRVEPEQGDDLGQA